jgi:ankyrin repeat protein
MQLIILRFSRHSRGSFRVAANEEALSCAAEKGHLEIVKCLVDNGADIHAGTDYSLRWAAWNGHLEIVDYLEKGEI